MQPPSHSFLAILPILILEFQIQKHLLLGLTMGAVKGKAMASIRLHNTVKRYGAIEGVGHMSLDINNEEFLILLGPLGYRSTNHRIALSGASIKAKELER